MSTKIGKRNKSGLLKKTNVVGVGYGHKYVEGSDTGEPCVSVLVEKKVPREELRQLDLVPSEIDGVKTDVVEVGTIKALARTDRIRPAPGGSSIGHAAVTAGTFGCLVEDDIRTFILSNNHVLANSNAAKKDDRILQPGPADGGVVAVNEIATLEKFEPIRFDGGSLLQQQKPSGFLAFIRGILCTLFGLFCEDKEEEDLSPNYFDAAIATPIQGGLEVTSEILEIGTPTGVGPADELVLEVKKSGRTTGLTSGRIIQTDADIIVDYGRGRNATFENQIISDLYSQGGDSGSAVLNNDNQVVGLLFAGSDTITVFSPIEPILDAFGVRIKV